MHPPSKDSVELFATSRDLQNTLTLLAKLVCRLEASSRRLHEVLVRPTCEVI